MPIITYPISIDSIFTAKNQNGDILETPYIFEIQSYQRGYRWEPLHINHLIDDLLNFINKASENDKYCLQPIIVKEIEANTNRWELVDGQQRMVSLWLLRRIWFWFRRSPRLDDSMSYQLVFDGKDDLKELVDTITQKTNEFNAYATFLTELTREENNNPDYIYEYFDVTKGKNVDIDCMIECFKSIILRDNIAKSLDDIFLSGDRNLPKAASILFIWYQLERDPYSPDYQDVIKVFTNINANKIQLTQSELIKAQLLYCFRDLTDARIDEETTLALRWEEIERSLCDDSFWYFLNAGDGKETGTRIDFLFEIWCKRENLDLSKYDKSDYPLSDMIEDKIKLSDNKPNAAKDIWKEICKLHDTLKDWKNDYYFYHLIGLIIAINKITKNSISASETIKNCYITYKKVPSKEVFKDYLKSVIRNQMFAFTDHNSFAAFAKTIDELNYENAKDKDKIKAILLIHNIASLINAENEHERFPFELFFTVGYDIEHINPQNPNEDNRDDLKKWFENIGEQQESDKSLDQLSKEAKLLADKLQIHSIGNLVLLDANTNRSEEYSNKSFFEKRRIIINILRTGKRINAKDTGSEKYIPIGTKWVFLKAFSDLKNDKEASIHKIWDGQEAYKEDLVKQLWLLQSGYKQVGNNIEYIEYENQDNPNREIGLVLDFNGKYHYLSTNKDGKIECRLNEIEILGDKTNGLKSEGKYNLSEDGNCEPVSDKHMDIKG